RLLGILLGGARVLAVDVNVVVLIDDGAAVVVIRRGFGVHSTIAAHVRVGGGVPGGAGGPARGEPAARVRGGPGRGEGAVVGEAGADVAGARPHIAGRPVGSTMNAIGAVDAGVVIHVARVAIPGKSRFPAAVAAPAVNGAGRAADGAAARAGDEAALS